SVIALTTNIEKDDITGIPSLVSRLAVGVKKRLLLYSWHDTDFREGKEVVLGGNVRSITWTNETKAAIGLSSGGSSGGDIKNGGVEAVAAPQATTTMKDPMSAADKSPSVESGQWGCASRGPGYRSMCGWTS